MPFKNHFPKIITYGEVTAPPLGRITFHPPKGSGEQDCVGAGPSRCFLTKGLQNNIGKSSSQLPSRGATLAMRTLREPGLKTELEPLNTIRSKKPPAGGEEGIERGSHVACYKRKTTMKASPTCQQKPLPRHHESLARTQCLCPAADD